MQIYNIYILTIGRGGLAAGIPESGLGPISPQGLKLLGDSNFRNREDWESLKVGANGPETEFPTIIRNARHPGSPYFPVENARPFLSNSETTTKNNQGESASGSPSTPEENETGPSRYGSNNRRNDERIDLKTKYFQITERSDLLKPDSPITSTSRPLSRIPILVKKIAKIPILKASTDNSRTESAKNETDLCKSRPDILECSEAPEDEVPSTVLAKSNLLPASFEPLLRHLRGEIWVVPVLVASACLAVVLIVFEIYLVSQVIRSSRRHQVQTFY